MMSSYIMAKFRIVTKKRTGLQRDCCYKKLNNDWWVCYMMSSYIMAKFRIVTKTSEGVFYIGGRGCVLCQFIEPVTFSRSAFIFALRNISLGGCLDTHKNI